MSKNLPNKPKRLRAHLEQHLHILDTLPFAILQVNKKYKVVWANLAANDLLQMDPFGLRVEDIFGNEILYDAVEASDEDNEEVRFEFEWGQRPTLSILATVTPLQQTSSQGGRMIMTLQDMTTQRQTESVRADFVANVSHELRTPLSTLVGFIETLQGPARDDPEASGRFLGIMRDQAARMSRLVEDLLSLSKIEMNAAVIPSGALDVCDLLKTVIESLSLQAETAKQQIVISTNCGQLVRGDADEMTQVFWNLVENALKYGRENGKVSVAVKSINNGTDVRIDVSDNGEGIEEEHLNRLTERFYRVDKGRSRAMGGTGLGLAIVKHIVARHRGQLLVASKVGEGSTFSVILPAHEDHSSSS
jgi:two-component system, OmpR family, phosphate regulon sensor histidine kinase PhoR